MAAASGEDLDLLLSLREDRVLETPPDSPSSNGSPRRKSKKIDMSVFRDAVKDYLNEEPSSSISSVPATGLTGTGHKSSKTRKPDEVIVEKFSGFRIRNLTISPIEINNHFSDIRFIRLSAIKNIGDNISGCWATAGVLLEKGASRVSSAGKTYSIWKFGSLDEFDFPVFLFNDSHSNLSIESVGTVFALFNCTVRRDNSGNGFILSVYSANQMIKMGISADYGSCKGKRKDGLSCTMTINKRKGAYCKFHTSNASQKYTTGRTELKGGNLHTAFRPKQEGIYMVDPFLNRNNVRKSTQPVKVMSVDALKKALSKADKVMCNKHSQGIRFLSHVTTESKIPSKNIPKILDKNIPNSQPTNHSVDKRSVPSVIKIGSKRSSMSNKEPEAKREKMNKPSEKIIELDFVSSDED